jgi:hypothetical protein
MALQRTFRLVVVNLNLLGPLEGTELRVGFTALPWAPSPLGWR